MMSRFAGVVFRGWVVRAMAALAIVLSVVPVASGVDVFAAVAAGVPLGGLGFVSVQPARVLDTRPGFQTVDELWAGVGSVGAGSVVTVRVGGRAGVPAAGVGSVVLNVTSVNASLPSHVSVYASGTERPVVSSLNPIPGVVTSNLVVASSSAAGEVSLFNASGTVDLVVDVTGWLPKGPAFTPVSPARLLDTRADGITVDGGGRANSAATAGSTSRRMRWV